MKLSAITLLTVFTLMIVASGNVIDHGFTKEKDAEKSEFSTLVFDASINIVEREYLNGDGVRITDKEKITSDTMNAERDVFFGDSVRVIQYLAEFTGVELVKGDLGMLKDLNWQYRNSAVSMCPHYPRNLITGKRYRFYVRAVKDQFAFKLQLLEIPLKKSKSEKSGTGEPTSTVGSEDERREEPNTESANRPQ